jgi:hypothetical protein
MGTAGLALAGESEDLTCAQLREEPGQFGAQRTDAVGDRRPHELIREGDPALNDPGCQASGVGTGGDELGGVECGPLPEQLQHTSLVHTLTAVGSEKANLARKCPSIFALPRASW